jgi:hypothetical protein
MILLSRWCRRDCFQRLLSALIRGLLERGSIQIDQGFIDATFAEATRWG